MRGISCHILPSEWNWNGEEANNGKFSPKGLFVWNRELLHDKGQLKNTQREDILFPSRRIFGASSYLFIKIIIIIHNNQHTHHERTWLQYNLSCHGNLGNGSAYSQKLWRRTGDTHVDQVRSITRSPLVCVGCAQITHTNACCCCYVQTIWIRTKCQKHLWIFQKWR